MRLTPCYSPKAVYNKYLGTVVVTRCGKCPACLNARAASWVTRLDLESQCYKYTFFVTFQYDEQHVNQLVRLRPEDCPDDDIYYIDSETANIIALSDSSKVVTDSDIQYCNNTKILLVPSVRDFQLFLKSLRKFISKKYDERIRYFNTFEIGPTTFRPHCHTLFFFDSDSLAQDFGFCCSRFWRYGAVFDPHPVNGSAASYVASYVNSFSLLPAIYLHPQVRQKSTFSKNPPIGFGFLAAKNLREVITSRLVELTYFRASDSSFIHVPLFRSFESRVFPRLPRFGLLSDVERVSLYGLVYVLPFFEQATIYDLSLTAFCCRYLLQLKGFVKTYIKMCFEDDEGNFNFDGLVRFVRLLFTFNRNRLECGFSVTEYVEYIVEYYENKESYQLSEFLNLQSSYFEEHSVREYLLMFPNFIAEVSGKPFGSLKDWHKYYLNLYGYNFCDSDIVKLRLSDCFDYRELCGLHDKLFYSNTKSKVNNDYLLAHKDKFGNVISYYDSL